MFALAATATANDLSAAGTGTAANQDEGPEFTTLSRAEAEAHLLGADTDGAFVLRPSTSCASGWVLSTRQVRGYYLSAPF